MLMNEELVEELADVETEEDLLKLQENIWTHKETAKETRGKKKA